MRAIVVIALLLFAESALAGSISIQVVETGQTTLTKTYSTIPDANIDRIVAAYQSAANTSVNGTATRAQVLNYWVTQFITKTIADVAASESNAAEQALPAIAPINPQ